MIQPITKITTNSEPLEKATKKMVFGRLLSPSATYFQRSATAATGEEGDELCCLKLIFTSLDCAVRLYLYRGFKNSINLGAVVSLSW